MASVDGKIRVLALSGGGIRGIIPARILSFIEQQTGKRISELFDMVCGTSTGGILAGALTKPNPLKANEALALYLQRGQEIFSSSWWHKVRNLGNTAGPKYSGEGLTKVLRDTFGDANLQDALIPTFMPAYGIESRSPIFFRSWVGGAPLRLSDVCQATSSGPTYFPPSSVNGAWYIDGGVIDNNPALSGVIEACMKYGVHTRDCQVLSIGTGTNIDPIFEAKARGWGQLGWVRPLIDIFTDGVAQLTHYQMSDLMPDLGYLHLQTALPDENASMDDVNPQNLAVLLQTAQTLIDSNSGPLVAFCDRLKG